MRHQRDVRSGRPESPAPRGSRGSCGPREPRGPQASPGPAPRRSGRRLARGAAPLSSRAVATLAALLLAGALSACEAENPSPGGSGGPAGEHEGGPGDARSDRVDGPGTPFAEPAAGIPPGFHDVAEAAGIDIVTWGGGADKDHILESVGTGAAFLDYDGDDRLDLYVVNAWLLDEEPSGVRIRGRNRLYRNRGDGTFEDVTDAAGVGDDGWGCGVAVADYDGDGRVDLYVTNFGPNVLYRNRGDGTFEDVSARAGVAEPGWGAGAAFFDAEGDGDPDLYVANYITCTEQEVLDARRTLAWRGKPMVMVGPFGLRGGIDRYFRNNGDGTFTEATDEVGMTDEGEGYGLGVLASDLDDDGDVDVYVANDSNQNYLFRNDGTGHFKDIGGWCGAGFSEAGAAQAGMGVDAGDFDGDGLQDLFVTNFTHDYSTLYRNVGDLFFEDVTARQPIKQESYLGLSWGCAFFDMDLDADLDLLVANGHIFPQVDDHPELEERYEQPLYLFRNDRGVYHDVAQDSGPGMQIVSSARGLALGDYDDDGDLDLLITAMDRRPLLLRNDLERQGGPFAVRLLDDHGAPALNAIATVHAGGRSQLREVRSGSTYQSQSTFDLYFGLGAAERVDSLVVRWPNGARTKETDLPVGRRIELREPPSP